MYILFVWYVQEVGVDLCDYITFDVVELHMYYSLCRWAAFFITASRHSSSLAAHRDHIENGVYRRT